MAVGYPARGATCADISSRSEIVNADYSIDLSALATAQRIIEAGMALNRLAPAGYKRAHQIRQAESAER